MPLTGIFMPATNTSSLTAYLHYDPPGLSGFFLLFILPTPHPSHNRILAGRDLAGRFFISSIRENLYSAFAVFRSRKSHP